MKLYTLQCRVLSIALLIPFITLSIPSLETAIEYQQNEQFSDAIVCYEEIVNNNPNDINAHFRLGCCYLAIGYKEKAINAFEAVLKVSPNALPARYNLAYAYKTFGDIETAIKLYKKITETNPDYEPAQLALGFAYITQGDFKKGWPQHERYLKKSGKNGNALRALLAQDDVAYKKILLHPEGGLGDTLNFIRYAERFKDMGADVIVACQKQLIPLLSRCDYIDQLIAIGTQAPQHDADATLMSLPAICADDEISSPHKIPYLYADPELIKHWQARLADDHNFKIGICWQVDAHNDTSKLPIARRGIPLNAFNTLRSIPGISLYSLQKHDGTEQIAQSPSTLNLHVFENLDEQSGPFMDTAALMKSLDLIITVDTAIAHLAGGLGCPVWLVHPYATADWRWIAERSDSHWYPTMRIFKQQNAFDYDGVMKQVKVALQQLLS